jgi:preprotein translocase subunit SecD
VTRFLIITACLAACALPAAAGGKKGDNAGISFHLETEEGGNPKMVFQQLVAGKERWFTTTPEISTRDIASFSPFPSQDPGSYGVALQLDRRGSNRLGALTTANKDKFLVAVVNGRVVDAVIIDKQVSDGMMIIWKGVTLPEIKAFDKVKPRLGEDYKTWKKRLRDS